MSTIINKANNSKNNDTPINNFEKTTDVYNLLEIKTDEYKTMVSKYNSIEKELVDKENEITILKSKSNCREDILYDKNIN